MRGIAREAKRLAGAAERSAFEVEDADLAEIQIWLTELAQGLIDRVVDPESHDKR